MQQTLQPKQWTFGLCDCCDDLEACTFVFQCTPCAVGYTKKNIGGDYCQACCLHYICPVFYPCCVTAAVRETKNIEGNIFFDFLRFCFCTPCEMTRVYRETKVETSAPLVLPLKSIYKQQQTMTQTVMFVQQPQQQQQPQPQQYPMMHHSPHQQYQAPMVYPTPQQPQQQYMAPVQQYVSPSAPANNNVQMAEGQSTNS